MDFGLKAVGPFIGRLHYVVLRNAFEGWVYSKVDSLFHPALKQCVFVVLSDILHELLHATLLKCNVIIELKVTAEGMIPTVSTSS